MHRHRLALALLACLLAEGLHAQTTDLTKQYTLYLVGYAHLDTQWRWEYPQTIGEFLPKTMRENFALFEKYPHYVFNFSGANRYRMMKEYFPAGYERLRGYVKAGRWFPAGSSMEESDVNSPSAESILRQVLYGNTFFRHELGRASAEYMLPDCFGFPASLPTLLAHAGIRGFSTQKLTWGSNAPVGGEGSPEATPKGTPFNVGIWEGVDGRSVIAALNPGDYSGDIRYDLTKSEAPPAVKRFIDWPKRVARNGEVSGVFADYHYYGTGDTGGSPSESSVALAEEMAARPDGALRVVSSAADQMFLDIAPGQTARLPRYRGDLELTNHSAGSITSQAYQKRWNHENELLADAAEKASVAAMWLGARSYPQRRLNDAWALVMGGQFHDIAAGTATPKAYEYSWNDDVIAMNQFTAVLTDATESIASSLDTRAQGVPVVVYNPLNVEREDVVELNLDLEGRAETGERRTTASPLRSPLSPLRSPIVIGPDGKPVPAQSSNGKVVFLARVPPTGFAVYDVRGAKEMIPQTGLKVDESSLESSRYRIKIDANGDISSILDKHLGRELLAAPIRLAFQTEKPHDWPAWNMDWDDQKQPPRGFVGGLAKVRVVENGPARAAIEITREAEGSKFVETILLAAFGDAANRIEIRNAIDWRSSAAALKATFRLAASNPKATYNWEVGTIERGNNEPRQFEVPSHQWIDLTDKSGTFGVTLLTGAKYGSDKPDDSTLRLTLLYTPGLGDGNGASYADQTSQDWGHHELTYGLASHGAAWREDSGWQALRLDQPLIAFKTCKHAGPLGKSFSLLRISRRNVRVLALKKAEESDDVVVRVVETSGKPAADVRLSFAAPVVEAHEVDGQERRIGSATIDEGGLITEFTPYQIRTFTVRLEPPTGYKKRVESQAIALTADRTVVTRDGAKSAPGFDDHGRNLPAEMLPPSIAYGPIAFQTNGGTVVAHGQQIALPGGKFTRLYLLAASADGDQKATFRIGDQASEVTVQDWSGKIGQWDTRLWKTAEVQLPPRPDAPPNAPPRQRRETQYAGLTPGFIKRAPLAWFASHRHDAEGANEPYQYSYLFAYTLDLPPNARRLTLPDNDKIRVLAITVSNEGPQIRPLQPLYDTLER